MSPLVKLVLLAAPLLLLLLTALAGYAYSQIRVLSLPISQALGLFTVVLPLITGISTQGAYGLIQRSSKNERYQLTIPLIAVIGFQLIYETVVATLAMTYVIPASSLVCGLETKWQELYVAKNEKAIKAIQDAFQCCGLHTVKDRAWPFRSNLPSVCGEIFKRSNGCLGAWRKAEQINAGMFVLVAVVVFIIKILVMIALLTNSTWAHAFKHRIRDGEIVGENNRATTGRLIEEPYHDDPPSSGLEIEAPTESGENRPRVEPSRLAEQHNEWRSEVEADRSS